MTKVEVVVRLCPCHLIGAKGSDLVVDQEAAACLYLCLCSMRWGVLFVLRTPHYSGYMRFGSLVLLDRQRKGLRCLLIPDLYGLPAPVLTRGRMELVLDLALPRYAESP